MNILVPTDYSDLSKVAIRYAIRFTAKIGGTVALLNVLDMVPPARKTMRERLKLVEKEILSDAKERLGKLAAECTGPALADVPVAVRVGRGADFPTAVIKEAKKAKADLIVMGTRGASGLKKYIVGSNTASVIEVSSTPVLVVPELGEFKKMRNIVFATDLTQTEKELKRLLPYVEKLNAIVHIIHVTASQKQVAFLERKIDAIIEKSSFKNVVVRVLVNRNVGEAIDQYVTTIKADLLATFTNQHGFYDKLFNKSITRKIAFQSKVPLLAFKQNRSQQKLK